MYRSRWWGLQHQGSDSSFRNFNYGSGDANVRRYCSGNYTWYGISQHEVTDGAQRYVAQTSNKRRIYCNL